MKSGKVIMGYSSKKGVDLEQRFDNSYTINDLKGIKSNEDSNIKIIGKINPFYGLSDNKI